MQGRKFRCIMCTCSGKQHLGKCRRSLYDRIGQTSLINDVYQHWVAISSSPLSFFKWRSANSQACTPLTLIGAAQACDWKRHGYKWHRLFLSPGLCQNIARLKKKKLIGLISSSVSFEDNEGLCLDEDFKPLLQRGGGFVISLVIQLMNSGGW